MAVGPTRIKEARVVALELSSQDETSSAVSDSTTSTTWDDVTLPLTFTPGTTGDYLVLAMMEVTLSDTGASAHFCHMKLNHTSGDIGEAKMRIGHTIDYRPWFTMGRFTSLSGSQTFKIQFKVGTSGDTMSVRKMRIVALRLDQFENVYYTDTRSRTLTGSTTYVDKLTLTQTPNAADHLILANGILDGSSVNKTFWSRFDNNGTAAHEQQMEPWASAGNDDYPFFLAIKQTLTATSHTWKIQYKTITNGFIRAGLDECAIAVLEMPAAVAAKPGIIYRGMIDAA